jgi:hypothetical protein
MTDLEMQKAWAFIKRKAFSPTNREQEDWIKIFNRFGLIKIGFTPNVNYKVDINRLDFKIIQIEPNISDKPTIKISSLISEKISEIILHFDPEYKVEFPNPDISKEKNLGRIIKNEDDLKAVLINYIAHPALHLHLPETENLREGSDSYHEIRIALGANNFFYLIYQTFFQILALDNHKKQVEIERLAKILWSNKTSMNPIAPGTLFPLGKK